MNHIMSFRALRRRRSALSASTLAALLAAAASPVFAQTAPSTSAADALGSAIHAASTQATQPATTQASTQASPNDAMGQAIAAAAASATQASATQAATQSTTTQASTSPTTGATTTQASTSPSTTQSTTTQASTSPSTTQSTTTQASATQPGQSRFQAGMLDHRSRFGQSWFPQPLAGPTVDASNEYFLLYAHQEDTGGTQDSPTVGVDSRFNMLTITFEANYLRQHTAGDGTDSGISTFDIALRHPLYQYVSQDNKVDATLGGRLLFGVPSGSTVGQDGRVEFDAYALVRLGDHWAVQGNLGVNQFIGPQFGGETTVPYTLFLGYRLERTQLNIPLVSETWLTAEIEGPGGLLASNSAGSPCFGVVGGFLDFNNINHFQPRLGLGVSFPLNDQARSQQDWGIVANFLVYY